MNGRQIDGRKLRDLRERGGLHPGELAAAVGCSKGHLRNLETAGDQPSAVLTYRLARALSDAHGRQVSIDEFSTRVGEKAVA